MAKRTLTIEEALQAGMAPILDEEMDNGERRFRRMHGDGSGYIRTDGSHLSEGGWQDAHSHHQIREFYAVEKGMICMVWMTKGVFMGRLLFSGQHFITEPRVPHNVYMFARTVIHTVKFNVQDAPQDWIAEPALDAFSKRKLDEGEIYRYYGGL